MIKASYFERIVRKVKDLKYCHCESADKQAKQSRIQYNDRQTTCFFCGTKTIKFNYNKIYFLKGENQNAKTFFYLYLVISIFPDSTLFLFRMPACYPGDGNRYRLWLCSPTG